MNSPITLEDVLAVKYLGKWEWSPDGKSIAYIWDAGGLHDLWMVRPGQRTPVKVTSAKKGVTDFAWCPDGDLYTVQDGGLCRVRAGTAAVESLFESKSAISGLAWSPDTSLLAFSRDRKVWLWRKSDGRLSELSLPGNAVPAGDTPGIVLWTPSSARFAFAFRDQETYRQIGVATPDGKVVWRSYFEASVRGLTWLGEETLLYSLPDKTGTSATFFALPVATRAPASDDAAFQPVLLHEVKGTGRGQVLIASAFPSPDGQKALFLLEDDGWAHYYLLDCRPGGSGVLKQVTFGQCEDFAHAGDVAEWLPDSTGFLYASNKANAEERRIYRHILGVETDGEVVGLPGTNSMVKVSPDGRIAFQHCDEFRNMDIWVAGPNGESPTQITFSMPEGHGMAPRSEADRPSGRVLDRCGT